VGKFTSLSNVDEDDDSGISFTTAVIIFPDESKILSSNFLVKKPGTDVYLSINSK